MSIVVGLVDTRALSQSPRLQALARRLGAPLPVPLGQRPREADRWPCERVRPWWRDGIAYCAACGFAIQETGADWWSVAYWGHVG